MTGNKFDKEKLRMELLDFDALEGLADALTYGAEKYGSNNWRLGINNSRIIGALLRHLSAYARGEDIDPETGLSHIDHVGANWMFLSANVKQRPDLDDRWCGGSECSSSPGSSVQFRDSSELDPEETSHLMLVEVINGWIARNKAQEAWKDVV